MKKILFATAGIMLGLSAMAGTNGLKSLQGGKGINNGFYIHLGFAFPTAVIKVNGLSTAQSLGFEPNLEIGSQWYFVKKDKWGFGMKVSWLQFGYSTYKSVAFNHVNRNYTGYRNNIQDEDDIYYFSNDQVNYTNKTSNLDLRLIKIAPQFTLGLNDDMAVDFSVEVSPTLMLGANGTSKANLFYSAYGVLFAPGARFRYGKFAVGFDLGFGSLKYDETREVPDFYYNSGELVTHKINQSGKMSVFNPRLYLGFKF